MHTNRRADNRFDGRPRHQRRPTFCWMCWRIGVVGEVWQLEKLSGLKDGFKKDMISNIWQKQIETECNGKNRCFVNKYLYAVFHRRKINTGHGAVNWNRDRNLIEEWTVTRTIPKFSRSIDFNLTLNVPSTTHKKGEFFGAHSNFNNFNAFCFYEFIKRLSKNVDWYMTNSRKTPRGWVSKYLI